MSSPWFWSRVRGSVSSLIQSETTTILDDLDVVVWAEPGSITQIWLNNSQILNY